MFAYLALLMFGLKNFIPYAGSAWPVTPTTAASARSGLVPGCSKTAPAEGTAFESRSLFPERVERQMIEKPPEVLAQARARSNTEVQNSHKKCKLFLFLNYQLGLLCRPHQIPTTAIQERPKKRPISKISKKA